MLSTVSVWKVVGADSDTLHLPALFPIAIWTGNDDLTLQFNQLAFILPQFSTPFRNSV
jgi:hypothetical protein